MSLNHGPEPQDGSTITAGWHARQLYRRRLDELERDPTLTQDLYNEMFADPAVSHSDARMTELTQLTVTWTRKRLKKAIIAELDNPEVIQYENQP